MRLNNYTKYLFVGVLVSNISFAQSPASNEVESKLLKGKPKAIANNFLIQNNKIQENEQELLKSLKRYEIVISKEKRPENIFAIELNRTVCYLQLARINRIKSGGKSLDPVEENYLRRATTTIEKLLKYEKLNNEIISQLKYFQGIALLDLGMKEISRNSFEKAVELNPSASYVPSLSLYLADLLYEESELDKAKIAYKRFYEKLSIDEKNLADYKVAWINLNQSKVDEALEIFIKLIQESNSSSIVQDSILSLAVAWADKYQEDEILVKTAELKTTEDKKLKLLQSIYDNFLKSPNRNHRKIWEKIIASETKEAGVTKLLSNELELLQFKDKIHNDIEFVGTASKIIEDRFTLISKYQKINLIALGQDLENLISKLTNVYQSKKDERVYQALSNVIELYLKFNEFEHQVEITSAYLDMLSDKKQSEKLIKLSYDVIKNPKLKSLKNKAKLIILIDLENKYLENPSANQNKFFNLVRVYLEDAKADQWQAVATKFYSYLVKVKNFEEAEGYMGLINKVFPSEDSFLKLVSVKYEQHKCSEIIELLSKRESLKPELIDYKRECYLYLASEAKKDLKNFEAYKLNINEFIKLADEKKKNIAEVDFILTASRVVASSELAISSQFSKVEYEELLSTKYYDRRFTEELYPLYQGKIEDYIEKGDYVELSKILEGCDKFKLCLPNYNFLKKVNTFKKIDEDILNDQSVNVKLDNDNVPYVSLLNPELIIDKIFKNEISIDKKFILVASRLTGVDFLDEQNKLLYDKFFMLLPKDEIKMGNLNSLKVLGNLKLPEFKTRHKLKDTEVLAYMTKVQKTRDVILNDLGNISTNNQKVVLEKAIDAEKKIAEIINLSPLPKNLDPSKKTEYEDGLKQLAEEFVKQAEAYSQALSKVDEQIELKKKAKEELTKLKIPQLKTDWNILNPVPTNDKLDIYLQDKKFYLAFFYLDYLNSQSKLSLSEYFYWRSLILFMSANTRNKADLMTEYIYNEFQASKVDDLLKNWKDGSVK